MTKPRAKRTWQQLASAAMLLVVLLANAQIPPVLAASAAAQPPFTPSAGYAESIARMMKARISFGGKPDENAFAEVDLKVAPTGEVLGYAIIRSSGNADWNEAVLKAMSRTPEIPRDVNGNVPASMRLTFRAGE